MRYFIIVIALVALFPLTTSAQSLEGGWQRTSITFEGGQNPGTSTQPSFVMFTAGHFVAMEINSPEPRPALWDSPSPADIAAAIGPFAALAGPYEMNGSTLVINPSMGHMPGADSLTFTFETSFDGNDSMTSVVTNPDGSTTTRKYVRIE